MSEAELIAAVSHELRQPLSSIRGFTEMLLAHWADFGDADKLGMLREILQDSVRVGRLIDDLLETSRLDAGLLPLHMSETDVGRVVERAVRNVKSAYPDLHADVHVAAVLEEGVMADPFRLEQVLTNIVENACKYGSPEAVCIDVERVQRSDGWYAEISVIDKGPGIPEQDLPHVTEKFYRGVTAPRRGLGLGLWISRRIIEAHGGQMQVLSGPGGTTMKFTIPLQVSPATGKLAEP